MWVLAQMPDADGAYDEPMAFGLRGPLDLAVLVRCLDALPVRHETLRIRLVEQDDQVFRLIDPPDAPFAPPRSDQAPRRRCRLAALR